MVSQLGTRSQLAQSFSRFSFQLTRRFKQSGLARSQNGLDKRNVTIVLGTFRRNSNQVIHCKFHFLDSSGIDYKTAVSFANALERSSN